MVLNGAIPGPFKIQRAHCYNQCRKIYGTSNGIKPKDRPVNYLHEPNKQQDHRPHVHNSKFCKHIHKFNIDKQRHNEAMTNYLPNHIMNNSCIHLRVERNIKSPNSLNNRHRPIHDIIVQHWAQTRRCRTPPQSTIKHWGVKHAKQFV